MREYITPLFLVSALNLFAQFPPIDLEWSAIRPYPELGAPNVHIARDPVHDEYVWAVMGLAIQQDEVANLFLPDGTDVTPTFPAEFNVGSLDGLVDLAVRDSSIFDVMRHESLAGLPYWWHLQRSPMAPVSSSWDHMVQNPAFPGDLSDFANDLLLTPDAVYGCGTSETGFPPLTSEARVVKCDLDGDVLWDATWDDPGNSVEHFSSIAVIGDTVLCGAFPNIVLFDANTGAFIDAYDFYGPGIPGEYRLIAHGTRVYWAAYSNDDLLYGYTDLATSSGLNDNIPLPGQSGTPHIIMDDQDRLWIGTTANGEGKWFRLHAEFTELAEGTLYESIDDMCFVNGRICFTGILDPASATAYVITGTPQP